MDTKTKDHPCHHLAYGSDVKYNCRRDVGDDAYIVPFRRVKSLLLE